MSIHGEAIVHIGGKSNMVPTLKEVTYTQDDGTETTKERVSFKGFTQRDPSRGDRSSTSDEPLTCVLPPTEGMKSLFLNGHIHAGRRLKLHGIVKCFPRSSGDRVYANPTMFVERIEFIGSDIRQQGKDAVRVLKNAEVFSKIRDDVMAGHIVDEEQFLATVSEMYAAYSNDMLTTLQRNEVKDNNSDPTDPPLDE